MQHSDSDQWIDGQSGVHATNKIIEKYAYWPNAHPNHCIGPLVSGRLLRKYNLELNDTFSLA